ncbi:MAG: serine/threonine protein kinase, partial [Planctomycetes bacterium]|nr:serine/threonine protein kinase [Planctomycetota bacterium]
GDSGGRVYLVMELVVGRSVGELLDSVAERDRANPPAGRPAGALAVEAVATIGAQVAKGLVDAHAVGIVHRDIKPDNIMVAGDGTAKIADLGLAKQLDDPDLQRLTGSGMVVGTPLYVSPDAIRNPESVNGQADVYSLGATLYHCLAGKPPFDGKTPYEVMKAHLEDRPQPLLELRPSCPRGLAQLVERCLAKDPKARPTPVELAELLARGPALAGTTHRGPLVA